MNMKSVTLDNILNPYDKNHKIRDDDELYCVITMNKNIC